MSDSNVIAFGRVSPFEEVAAAATPVTPGREPLPSLLVRDVYDGLWEETLSGSGPFLVTLDATHPDVVLPESARNDSGVAWLSLSARYRYPFYYVDATEVRTVLDFEEGSKAVSFPWRSVRKLSCPRGNLFLCAGGRVLFSLGLGESMRYYAAEEGEC